MKSLRLLSLLLAISLLLCACGKKEPAKAEPVEDAVAERMLDGTLGQGDTAKLLVENDQICITKAS